MIRFRTVRLIFMTTLILLALVIPAAAQGGMSLVSVGSPPDTTP